MKLYFLLIAQSCCKAGFCSVLKSLKLLINVKYGTMNFVYLCDFKTAKEWFSKPEFADRPSWESIKVLEGERRQNKVSGIVFSNGNPWIYNRRFLVHHLQNLGMGKSKIEGLIMREVEGLVEEFKGLTKEPSILPKAIHFAVANVIWQLVSSHRFSLKDEKVQLIRKKLGEISKSFPPFSFIDFYPVVKYFIPRPVLNYIIGLMKIMLDMFRASNSSTARIIRLFLVYMSSLQEIQERIQKEIDKVVPRDSLPGLEHRNELTYLDATINEVLRHSSVLPIGVLRCAAKDVRLEGYDIPKGTAVISLEAFSHSDPTYFETPNEFNPSRFLDGNGKYFPTCDGFQAFGLGKRQCPGEQFARMELYLMISALMQNFTFAPPDDEGQMSIAPSLERSFQIPDMEQKFKIRLRN
ncbi:Cytochrome P450 2L1 [Armadillidium nasatum]|uniref:Cytochrome P450 2L1 n=1 Tax=Armadillidium nasatum TaxID=96803 RepID=A0A5N5T7N9_9CRUS|nr:Cytochrome P450 2L1 [Armadillidium nasatum]